MRLTDELEVKGAVHITGDAYMKFERLSKFSHGVGFEFDNFTPQPIFDVIKNAAKDLGSPISDEEMFRTFNMGWGFAVVVEKSMEDETLGILEQADIKAERIGKVRSSEGIRIIHRRKKIVLS
jgi:phosphoribosylformylglycinamidine cyclo-ligase